MCFGQYVTQEYVTHKRTYPHVRTEEGRKNRSEYYSHIGDESENREPYALL